MAVSGDELRDAARLARESVVVGRAVTLARWIGTGRRPGTAGQVLHKADVPVACAALGRGRAPPAGRKARHPAAPPPRGPPGPAGLLRARGGVGGLLAWLADRGAVVGDRGKPLITPLGCWAAGHLAAGLPGLADPSLSASEMIAEVARFGDEEQQDHVAWGWLAERQPAEAAREILTAAEGMSPLLRVMAVGVVQRLRQKALA